ncbi:hypothetical protein [Lactococcus lactis]|uniref:Uncharacterized protein n=1 Tax=Lactococcus lactis TaxID=1358 RepID=A0AAP3Z0N3_9LACT|nr:hypothetical protein [Lactococcus lactis]MDG4976088.1 hypothetical protein [Lactococcus lactis]
MTETAKELLRKTKVIRDNFYPEPIESEHEDELKITFEFLSEVINYLENETDKLSVEKLQEIRITELKDFNSKILQAELKNQKLQELLNTAKKALTEIRANIEEHNQIYDLSVDTALLLEGIDGIALEAIGENHD